MTGTQPYVVSAEQPTKGDGKDAEPVYCIGSASRTPMRMAIWVMGNGVAFDGSGVVIVLWCQNDNSHTWGRQCYSLLVL